MRLVAGTISAPLVNPGKKIISILFALFFFGSLCTQNEWFRSTKCVLSYYLLKREVIKEITTVRSAEKNADKATDSFLRAYLLNSPNSQSNSQWKKIYNINYRKII